MNDGYSGLGCRETLGMLLTWAQPEPKMTVFPVPCAQLYGEKV